MTALAFIFAWAIFGFAVGVLFGRHINEGQREPFAGDDQTPWGDVANVPSGFHQRVSSVRGVQDHDA